MNDRRNGSAESLNFSCSPLSLEDFPEIIELEPRCYENPWSKEVLYSEFVKEVSLRIGLRTVKGLCGYCFNHLILDELHILNLAVDPDYQNAGGGALLLEETLREARRRGALRAFLEVRPSNGSALALYHKFGFRRLGVRKQYYRNNGEDALVLESDIEFHFDLHNT